MAYGLCHFRHYYKHRIRMVIVNSNITTIILELVFWVNALVFGFVLVGYPVLAFILGRCRTLPKKIDDGYCPSVTLLISAYNEEQDIRQKIENALSLSYPKDKLKIIVISDASSDSTDEIVLEFVNQGVQLHRMEQRGGKTVGLNAVIPEIQSEILVFTDANAFFHEDAIQKLVRNFSDSQIGCVTGDSQYVGAKYSSAGSNEKLYWDYDRELKIAETRFGSMVGADGAIFAIRKSLYSPLGPKDINDFVLPLRIVGQGLRCIFEKEAICEEASTLHMAEEYHRKVRVVNRSWTALLNMKYLLNPISYGWFSVQLWSHKVLRWLSPIFLFFMFFSSLALSFSSSGFFLLVVCQVVVYGLGLLAWKVKHVSHAHWLLSGCAYIVVINMASIVGVSKSFMGQSIIMWDPIRASGRNLSVESKSPTAKILFFSVGSFLVLAIWNFPTWSFWVSILLLFHVFVGYPLSLFLIASIAKKPWVRSSITPSVTLLVVAYNEENVLKQKIENCLALDYPKPQLSILVCSDGSTDRTNEILREYQDKIFTDCFPERSGKAAVIEKVVAEISSEIIVFSDANTFLQKNAIEMLVRNFADDSVGAVSGKVTLVASATIHGKSEGWYYRYEWNMHYLESLIYTQIGVDGAMYAIRRDCFPKHLGHSVNDDFYIGFRAALLGKRVVFDEDAQGSESSEGTLKSEFFRKVRITSLGIKSFLKLDFWPKLSQPFLLYQLVSHKILRWFTPFLMGNVFLTSILLMDVPIFKVALILQLLFYGYAILGYVLKFTAVWLTLPMYFCLVNCAAGVGVVKGFLFKQPKTWERLEARHWAL